MTLRGTAPEPESDAGFTILETVLALALVAAVIVGMAVSASAGLRLTGRSNSRQVAVQAAVRSIELYRTFSFDALELDTTGVYGFDGAGTPDEDVKGVSPNRTYTVPLKGSPVDEPLVEVADGAVKHKEVLPIGRRSVTTYRYVTYTSSNKDEKRLTVVAVSQGTDSNGAPNRAVMSSVFSKGRIDFATTTLRSPGIPAHAMGATNISIPVDSSAGFPSTGPFSVKIDTEYFTVTNPSGTNWLATAHGVSAHAPGALVVLAANFGGSGGGGAPPVPAPPPGMTCGSDNTRPSASDPIILKGTGTEGEVGFTSSATISVVNGASDPCTPLQMKFAQDSATNLDAPGAVWQVYSTNTALLLTGADGNKTIYARYQDDNANSTNANLTASVTLDRTRPSPAPVFAVSRSGGGGTATITWNNITTDNAMSNPPYRVFRRTGALGPFIQLNSATADIKCTGGSGGPCNVTIKNLDSSTGYSFYIAGIDRAGNLSDANPPINV